jgi:hypothetical protein
MSHYIGGAALAKEVGARANGQLNTDDHTVIEFAFARSLGANGVDNVGPLRSLATDLHDDRPRVTGELDWDAFAEQRALADAIEGDRHAIDRVGFTGPRKVRVDARVLAISGKLGLAAGAWSHQPEPPREHRDVLLRAEGLAVLGDDVALADIAALRAIDETEADFVLARLRLAQHRGDDAGFAMIRALAGLHSDAFANVDVAKRSLQTAFEIAVASRRSYSGLVTVLSQPFAAYIGEEERIRALLSIVLQDDAQLAAALAPIEPDVPWSRELLTARYRAYTALGDPKASRARIELEQFLDGQAQALVPEAIESEAAGSDAN